MNEAALLRTRNFLHVGKNAPSFRNVYGRARSLRGIPWIREAYCSELGEFRQAFRMLFSACRLKSAVRFDEERKRWNFRACHPKGSRREEEESRFQSEIQGESRP